MSTLAGPRFASHKAKLSTVFIPPMQWKTGNTFKCLFVSMAYNILYIEHTFISVYTLSEVRNGKAEFNLEYHLFCYLHVFNHSINT